MSIGTEVSAVTFTGIVPTVPLNCNFPLFSEDEVQVVYGLDAFIADLGVDYSVTLDDVDFSTFIITPLSPLVDKINALIAANILETNSIVIRRVLDYTTSVQPESVRRTDFLSRELDRTIMRFQQLSEAVKRGIRLNPKYVGSTLTALYCDPPLPNVLLIGNADGTGFTNGPDATALVDVTSIADDVAAAEIEIAAQVVTVTTLTGQAAASATLAAGYAAGLNIPAATLPNALKSLRVKSDGTGYELYTAPGGGTGVLKDMNIGQGVEDDGSSNLRVKLDGATLARGGSGIKIATGGVGSTELAATAVTPGPYTNANITVDADGRITDATSGSAGLTSISQGNINTSTGTVSIGGFNSNPSVGWWGLGAVSSGSGISAYTASIAILDAYSPSTGTTQYLRNDGSATLPGGQYGFYPQVKTSGAATTLTGLAQQRYVTASPPFDLGDGATQGFIFVLFDSLDNIVSTYAADVPPWAYNGPTDIRADVIDGKGVKYRKIKKAQTLEQILDGAAVEYRLQEITHKIKNADMVLIPSPFIGAPQGSRIILLDPMHDSIGRLIKAQNDGDDIQTHLLSGLLKFDSTPLKRKGPGGVIQVSLKGRVKREV